MTLGLPSMAEFPDIDGSFRLFFRTPEAQAARRRELEVTGEMLVVSEGRLRGPPLDEPYYLLVIHREP